MTNQSVESTVRLRRLKEAAERFAHEHEQSFEVPGARVDLIKVAMMEGASIALNTFAEFTPRRRSK